MKNEFRKWIGARLIHFRTTTELNQGDMANAVGKTRPAYAAYEEGRAEPSIHTLKVFCEFFEITLDEFMEGSPEPATEKC